ncbi:ketose-bisphosphate aldolase [Oscillospiraceae bacterium MB08-C2-2]|nr:ketose-bisphosphate aldolase [Oscillospiraceae bacterium MB08-C2-2]
MPIVNMKQMLADAAAGGYGVGCYSTLNLEMTMGAIKAAEETNTPIMIQVPEMRAAHSPLHMIVPLCVSAAKASKVDICVHFDHGATVENIQKVLDMGMTSVMIDKSHSPLDENIAITKDVIARAHKVGATVEAEIGCIGRTEEGMDSPVVYSDVDQCIRMVEETGIDALAVGIGNIHGVYMSEPKLNFEVLQNIAKSVNVPLVLHGGSGISPEDFRECIKYGIRKINIATASWQAMIHHAREYLADPKANFFGLNEALVAGTYEQVMIHNKVFSMK